MKKGGMPAKAKGDKTAYIDANHMAKHAIWLAKSGAKKEEFTTVSPDRDGIFRIAKQMDHTNQDVVGDNCVRNDGGEHELTDKDRMKAWIGHYARLPNAEFEWPSNELHEVHPTAAIFVVRHQQEKYMKAYKLLCFAFVDLEKAFDGNPRKNLKWALRSLGVEEWAVAVIQGVYSNARVNGQYSEGFGVGVDVHQGPVLSPLLFTVLVLEALSREFRTGVAWELLYVDELVLIADTQEECISKLKAWKAGIGK